MGYFYNTPFRVFCQPHTGYYAKIFLGDKMDTRLKDLREDHDLTQTECAKIAFISKNSYIRYENGERVPPLDVIKIYAEYYKVSIDYIAKLSDSKRM